MNFRAFWTYKLLPNGRIQGIILSKHESMMAFNTGLTSSLDSFPTIESSMKESFYHLISSTL